MTPKKTVVLCEGRHDLIFLSLLLKRNKIKFLSKNWDAVCGRSPHSGEDMIISDFLRNREHSSVLLKQDENRDTCIKFFWKIYGYGDPRYSLRVVLDCDDGTSPDNFNNERLKKNKRVFLNRSSDFIYSLNTDPSSGVFYYPNTLTFEVMQVTGINLDNCHNHYKQEAAISEFLLDEPKWVSKLEGFLMSDAV